MAIVEMQKISICALQKHRKEILEFLQRTGAMELIREDVNEGFETVDTSQDRSNFEKIADSFDHILELLKQYAPAKSSGLGLEKKLITRSEQKEVVKKVSEYYSQAKNK